MPVYAHAVRNCLEIDYSSTRTARQRAGELLNACLDDERQVNFSLSYWPVLGSGRKDASLEVGYQMLWHFECDAGMDNDGPHKTDAFYTDIQFEMLKHAADALLVGDELPIDLLTMYQRYEPTKDHRPRYYLPWNEMLILTLSKRAMRVYTKLDALTSPLLRPFLPPERIHTMFKWIRDALHIDDPQPPLIDAQQRPIYPRKSQAPSGMSLPKTPVNKSMPPAQGYVTPPNFPSSRLPTKKKPPFFE